MAKRMKTKTISMTALALLPVALFTLASCSSTSESPPPVGSAEVTYKKGVPGGMVVQTDKVTATVTAVDQAKRTATLQGASGKEFTVKVGREAVNFDQVRVGDRVIITVTQKLAVSLADNAASAGDGAAAVAAPAPNGGPPGGSIRVTGTIVAIDPDKRIATLQFEDGGTQTYPIRADIDLGRLKLGQQVAFRVTEMTAIWVEKVQ